MKELNKEQVLFSVLSHRREGITIVEAVTTLLNREPTKRELHLYRMTVKKLMEKGMVKSKPVTYSAVGE